MDSIIIPPEIVTKILSNLGKSDLLNCRLVCNFWNKECLKHLRKSKFTQPLCESSIKSYMEFVKCNQHAQFVLPFCIHVGIDFSNEMRIHEMNEFIKHLILLTNMFGPDCVISLGLAFKKTGWDVSSGKIAMNWFVQVLGITSFGLKMLDFSNLNHGLEQRLFLIKAVRILKQQSTHFQNLKKLKLDTDSYVPLFQFIFDNSPKLQKLKISHGYISIISSIPIHFENLKTLKLCHIKNSSNLLRIIQKHHSFPVLQKLNLGLSVCSGIEKKIFYDILNSFSETIKSLTIIYEEYIPGLIIPFPTFPQLRYLKLIMKTSSLIHLDCQRLNFKPETFPMLKFIVVPVGCVFLSHCLLESLSLDVSTSTSTLNSIFSNIQHLTLNVHDWNLKTSRSAFANTKLVYKMFHKNVEDLQSIFPNVTDIVIVDKPKETKHRIQELIKKLIQSSRASIIQNFTLRNCEQDYLGKVLNPLSFEPLIFLENLNLSTELKQTIKDALQNMTESSDDIRIRRNVLTGTNPEKNISIVQENISAVNHNMKNVTTIKFEYSRMDEDGEIRSIKNGNMIKMTVNMLDLTLIIKEFPNLCQIGISTLLFDEDQHKRSEQIHDIRTQFPTITINII